MLVLTFAMYVEMFCSFKAICCVTQKKTVVYYISVYVHAALLSTVEYTMHKNLAVVCVR